MIDLKTLIPKELRKKNGVYSIRTKHNNKYYFGSTGNLRGFYKRWTDHLIELRNNCHKNEKLQNTYNKYGEDNLEFKIRTICRKEFCVSIEQKYLDVCLKANINNDDFNKLGYNTLRKAYSSLGYKQTEEAIRKMIDREIKRPFFQINNKLEIINKFLTAREASEKLKLCKGNISACLRGHERYNTVGGFSFIYCDLFDKKIEEIQKDPIYYFHGRKIAKTIKDSKKVRMTNLDNGEITEFPSANKASIAIGKHRSSVAAYININKGRYKNYKFEYI